MTKLGPVCFTDLYQNVSARGKEKHGRLHAYGVPVLFQKYPLSMSQELKKLFELRGDHG